MLGRYPEAMEMVDRSLQLDPNYVDAHNVRGAIYMDKNAYASAVMEFNTAIALDKSYKWAFSNKANILQMLGRYNDALSASESAIEIDPLFRYAYKIRGLVHSGLGNYSQALDDLQRAADTNPPDTSVYLDMAKLLGKTGRVEEGLELLQKVTVEDDSSRCARASLLMKLGKREEAFQQLEVCIQNELKLIEDDAAQAGNHYGTAAWYWYLQEQYEKSIEAGRKALEYDDASATVNLNLGLSFIATGKFDAAKQAYAAAIAKLDEMGTSSAEEGIDDLDMLLEKRPELSKPIAEARQSLHKLLKELLAMPIRDESRAAAV
jgi:tetratricopeptide (TPR) repeat protein